MFSFRQISFSVCNQCPWIKTLLGQLNLFEQGLWLNLKDNEAQEANSNTHIQETKMKWWSDLYTMTGCL